MPDQNPNIDKLFQQHLKGHKIPAPANAWARLEKDLHPPAKARFIWFTRVAAASVLLLLAFGAGYFLSETNRTFDYQLAENPVVNELNTTASISSESNQNLQVEMEDAITKDLQVEKQQYSTRPVSKDLSNNDAVAVKQTSPGLPDNNVAKSVSPSPNSGLKTTNQKTTPTPAVASSDQLADNTSTKTNQENKTEAAATTNEQALRETGIIEVGEATAESQPIPSGINENSEDINNSSLDEVPVMSDEMLHQMLIADHDFADELALANAATKNNSSNWSIGGQLSPSYSYRNVEGSTYNTPDESVDVEFFNDNEEGMLSMGGGISLNYRFTDRLSLGSGMYLSRIGMQNNEVLAYSDPQSNSMYKLATSSGTVSINPKKFETVLIEQATSVKDSLPGDYSINGSFTQNLDYLEIPLIVNYKVIDKKFSLKLLGGLSPGILVNNRSYFEVEGQKLQTGTTEHLSPMIYNSVIGLGLEYAISEKFSVNMSPAFKYSLTPVNSTNGLNYHPYSLSWFTGVSYKLY